MATEGGVQEGTVAALCQALWSAERELDLLRWETRGVRLWEASRMTAYYAVARAAGVLEMPAVQLPPGVGPRVKRAVDLVRAGVLSHPLSPATPAKLDALIFESGRAYPIDDRMLCPYTFALTAELTRQGKHLLLVDRRAPGQPQKSPDPRRRRLEGIELLRAVAGPGGAVLLDRAARAKIDAIDVHLARSLGRPIAIRAILAGVLARFLVDRALYRRMLAIHRPEVVYCVVAYSGHAPLVATAREAGIRSVELQHGVISRYHLGYSFPGVDFADLAYFPDQLYTWGEPWDTLMDDPVPEARRVPYGFRYFQHEAARHRGEARDPRRILVISQGTIGRELAETVLRLLPRLPDCRIDYKLHPSEVARWREYPALVALSEQPNVTLCTTGNLYELMARAQWQLGVYSTALYEGHALGLRTALVRLPGIEYMSRWFERGTAIDAEALPEAISGASDLHAAPEGS
jgi:hypothetical protein